MVMSCGGLFWQVAFGQKLELESEAAERMMELKQLREAEKQREGAAAKLRSDLAAAGAGGEELAAALASREAELTAAKKQVRSNTTTTLPQRDHLTPERYVRQLHDISRRSRSKTSTACRCAIGASSQTMSKLLRYHAAAERTFRG